MKRLALAIVFAAASIVSAEAQSLTFDFSEPKAAKKFETFANEWSVKKDAYGTSFKKKGQTASLVKKPTFGDVTARATIKKLDGDGFGGVLVRSRMSGLKLYGYGAGIQVYPDLVAVQIIRFDGENLKTGDGTSLAICLKYITLEKKSNLEFTAIGKELKLYYNGELVCSVGDSLYTEGRVGFAAGSPLGKVDVSFSKASFSN